MEAILADAHKADVRLGWRVERIDQSEEADQVIVSSANGDEAIMARAVIVTAPRNALGAIQFVPGLSEGKQNAADEGHMARGTKVWIEVRGHLQPVALWPT